MEKARLKQLAIGALLASLGIFLASLLTQYHKPTQVQDQVQVDSREQKFVWSARIQNWALDDDDATKTKNEDNDTNLHDCLWPDDDDEKKSFNTQSDRIIEQLKFKPRQLYHKDVKIALANEFVQQVEFTNCRVSKCKLTSDLYEAQVVIFTNANVSPIRKWPKLYEDPSVRARQIWLAHLLESPPNTFDLRFERAHQNGRQSFNWTATYRSHSDIVTPYSKFVPFVRALENRTPLVNNSTNQLAIKSKQKRPHVAWFVSNCHTPNERLEYALELAQHIPVDIYGKCGQLSCSKWSHVTKCLEELNSNYMFYLAFENSNHREYITEKLYQNALGYNNQEHLMVPVVLGAPLEDYKRLAPPNSFIHVDEFESPRALAAHLQRVARDEHLYLSYFKWKSLGRFIDTKFLCRVCALAHETLTNPSSKGIKSYPSLRDWWLKAG